MLLGLGALTALFMLVAPLLIRPFHPPDVDLAVGLSRVLFPIVALLGASGIIVGILNSYDHFSIPALTPVFWNLAIIAGLALGVPRAETTDGELYVYAGSILVGTLIQVLLPVPWLRGRDDRLRLVIDWRDPAVARTLKLMLPVTLGLGLINVNALVDTFFASRFIDPEIAPTAIDKAFRIYMLPQGMFSVAVATVLFPSLARLAARSDVAGFRHTVAVGLRQIAFLLVPASIATAVLAVPMVRLLYQRGEFDAHQTHVVAGALAAFSLGLMFNGTMLMLNRAFFSLQDNWIPTAVALGNLGVNAALDLVFLPSRGLGDPARDVGRQRRRNAGAPRRPSPPARSYGDPRDGDRDREGLRRVSPARGRGLSDLARARRGARARLAGAGRLVGSRSRRGRRRVPRSVPRAPGARNRGATLPPRAQTRVDDAWTRRRNNPRSGTSRSSRTSITGSRRSPTGSSSSPSGLGARHARPAARLDGPRARARDHDQGPGGPRDLEGP